MTHPSTPSSHEEPRGPVQQGEARGAAAPVVDSGASRGSSRGLALVLGGTVLSAASSFIVLLIVAPALGPEGYASFSVYWGALFMLVAVLFGVQQETTRGVAAYSAAQGGSVGGARGAGDARGARSGAGRTTSTLAYAAVIAVTLLVVIAGSGSLWSERLFGSGAGTWAIPLAVAVAAYVVVAAVNGILAGTETWGPFALLAVIDAVLRLLFVVVVLIGDWGGTALAWAVALPFPLSLAVVFMLRRSHLLAHARVAESRGQLTANIGRTVAASVATAVLINGFPVVLSLVGGAGQAELGAVVLAVTLTRAPILVPLTALQSMLISRFSGSPAGRTKLLIAVVVVIAALTALVALFVWAWGGALLAMFFGDGFVLAPAILAALVAAAGCLGIETATGAAVLSTGNHTMFAVGWIVAAVVAVAVVAIPFAGLGERVALALVVGPLIGSALHAFALTRKSR